MILESKESKAQRNQRWQKIIKHTVACALSPFTAQFLQLRNQNSGGIDWILFTHPTCFRKKTTLPISPKCLHSIARSSGTQ